MENIKEQKKAYKEAYAWALKVQKACLLKPVDISVNAGYCEGNDNSRDLAAYTVEVDIWDQANQDHIVAMWATFRPDFEDRKAVVEAYLKGKGITIK